jgi:hypothetical protein
MAKTAAFKVLLLLGLFASSVMAFECLDIYEAS